MPKLLLSNGKEFDNMGNPAMRHSLNEGFVDKSTSSTSVSRYSSNIEDDIGECQLELELGADIEHLDIHKADGSDTPEADITSVSSRSSHSELMRSDSRSDLGFIKRHSLINLAKRMDDLDATLEDFHRIALLSQTKNIDFTRSDISVGSDDVEELRRELDMAGTIKSVSDIKRSLSSSSLFFGLLDRQDSNEDVLNNKKRIMSSHLSSQYVYPGKLEATSHVTSKPSRLELLKAKNKLLCARSSKKLEEFIQGFRDCGGMNADEEHAMSGESITSQSSSAHEQIPDCIEFKSGYHELCSFPYIEEEEELQQQRESLKQLLESVKCERDRLQKDLNATREESRRVRRLFWILSVLVLCALFWRREYSSVMKSVNEKAYSSAMSFLNNNGYYSVFNQIDNTDDSFKPVRRRLSVKPEVLPELKPIKMDEKLNRRVIRLSSNFHTFNSTIDSESETEGVKYLEKNEKKRIQSRIKLIRGAFCRRSRRRIIQVVRGLKLVARKLLGDSEAGGVLDFKHNNVGVWAKTATI